MTDRFVSHFEIEARHHVERALLVRSLFYSVLTIESGRVLRLLTFELGFQKRAMHFIPVT